MSAAIRCALDLREEVVEADSLPSAPTKKNQAQAHSKVSRDLSKLDPTKAKFIIRTLPKECNPVPIPANNVATPRPQTPRREPLMSPTSSELGVMDNPFDDITEEKILHASGKTNLSDISYLELSVDSSCQSVELIGELLPTLQQLRLKESNLHSFRDLGTSLLSLEILWASRCGLQDLDGIGALTNLQELYLQYNEISDISPLTMHEELQVLDLEGNCLSDIGQVEQLAFCPQLNSLNLAANPVCKMAKYRSIITSFLPQLVILDDRELTSQDREPISDAEIDLAIRDFKDQLETKKEGPSQDALMLDVQDEIALADSIRSPPPSSSEVDLPTSALSRSSSSAWFEINELKANEDEAGSHLTHGTDIVFAGNVTSALRKRRSETDSEVSTAMDRITHKTSLKHNHSKQGSLRLSASRLSITDTLNRVNELDTYKSRADILKEVESWQKEKSVSYTGATNAEREHEPSSTVYTRRPKTSDGMATAQFAWMQDSSQRGTGSRSKARRATVSSTMDKGSHHEPEVLNLEAGEIQSDKRKRSGTLDQWNLGFLSPKVNAHHPSSIPMASVFTSRQSAREYDTDSEEDINEANSDSDDNSKEHTSRKSMKKSANAFFNVSESLSAITRWRDEMEDGDEISVLDLSNYQKDLCSPCNPTKLDGESKKGPAVSRSDNDILSMLQSKAQALKTRDGFRKFFHGIERDRLKALLSQVYADTDKVYRRMQIMEGRFQGQ